MSNVPSFDPEQLQQLNPLAMWRDWVARSEAQWSEAAGKLLKDPQASPALNRQIEEARHAQRLFAEAAQGTLALVNLPSRSDLEALDERLGRVEDGLAAVSTELVRLREALAGAGHAAVAEVRPPRTRKVAAPVAPAAPGVPAAPETPATAGGKPAKAAAAVRRAGRVAASASSARAAPAASRGRR